LFANLTKLRGVTLRQLHVFVQTSSSRVEF